METKSDDLTFSDTWDDTLLLKAYNKATKLSKEALAKRVAQLTNSENAIDKDEVEEAHSSSAAAIEEDQFKIGDFCRVTYEEDGIDYEAKIISIDKDIGICLVKFIGYENEQEVKIKDLNKSLGKKSRREQFAESKKEIGSANEANSCEMGSKNTDSSTYTLPGIPPLPPMPPMLAQRTENCEHLQAMLISWYMSGYYTGFYEGVEYSKKTTKQQ